MALATGLTLSLLLKLLMSARGQFPVSISDILLMVGCTLVLSRHRRTWIAAELALTVALVAIQVIHDDTLKADPVFPIIVDGLNLSSLALLLAATSLSWRTGRRTVTS